MLLYESFHPKPRRHRGVLQRLHLYGFRGTTTFQLRNHEVTASMQTENIKPVPLPSGPRPPTVKLRRDNHDVWPQNLGMRDHPLLQVMPLPQPGILQRDWGDQRDARPVDREDKLSTYANGTANLCSFGRLWSSHARIEARSLRRST